MVAQDNEFSRLLLIVHSYSYHQFHQFCPLYYSSYFLSYHLFHLFFPPYYSLYFQEAAVQPAERFRFITEGPSEKGEKGSIVHVIRNDAVVRDFGLNDISQEPMATSAVILPPAKLQYGGGVVVEPQLSGTWNMEGKKFAHIPANADPNSRYCN